MTLKPFTIRPPHPDDPGVLDSWDSVDGIVRTVVLGEREANNGFTFSVEVYRFGDLTETATFTLSEDGVRRLRAQLEQA